MQSVRHDGGLCPRCGKHLDAHAAADARTPASRVPKPGDIAVCMYCGTPLMFDVHRRLAVMTEQDVDQLTASEVLALDAALDIYRRIAS